MAQDYIKFGKYGTNPIQYLDFYEDYVPLNCHYMLETTDDTDTTRTTKGNLTGTPLFVVEKLVIEMPPLPASVASSLLKTIIRRKGNPYYYLHFYSSFHGAWKTKKVYTTTSDIEIECVAHGDEVTNNITINATCIEPLED